MLRMETLVPISALPLQHHQVLHNVQELQEEAEIRHRDKRKALVKLQKVLTLPRLLAVTRTQPCLVTCQGPHLSVIIFSCLLRLQTMSAIVSCLPVYRPGALHAARTLCSTLQ